MPAFDHGAVTIVACPITGPRLRITTTATPKAAATMPVRRRCGHRDACRRFPDRFGHAVWRSTAVRPDVSISRTASQPRPTALDRAAPTRLSSSAFAHPRALPARAQLSDTMITHRISSPRGRRLLLCFIAFASTPALADHLGPSGFGAGGGASVFGPGTLDEKHWSMGFRLTYTRPERRSDAELAALAGQHVHAHNTDNNLNASLGIAYGITHHLTFSAELPYVRRDDCEKERTIIPAAWLSTASSNSAASAASATQPACQNRLTAGTGPGLALIGGVKMPTGSTGKRSLQGERLETEHQPGTGSWDPILGASASAPMGPVGLTASLLYQFSGEARSTRAR